MAPFAEVLHPALDNRIFQFRGMTAGVTRGYEEVARTILRLSDALYTNNTTMAELGSTSLSERRGRGSEASAPSASTTIAGATPVRPTVYPFYTPARAPTVASEDGKDDDLDTAPAGAEVTVWMGPTLPLPSEPL
jgi:hypothetical protein